MPYIEGQIISGDFDGDSNIFSLQRVKHFYTETSLKENQVKMLCNYLKEHENEADGQIITLYDQMLVPLSSHEIKELLGDLEKIQGMYH